MARKTLLAFCAAALLTVSVFGQTADEVLEKNLKAMGGKDKIKALQSMRITGTMKMGPLEAPFTITKMRPSSFRMDITIQGMVGTQAYDGATGWSLMPFMGNKDPEKMGEDKVKDVRVDADFDEPTFDYKSKGNKVQYVGKEDVEGTPVYKLHVTTKDGTELNDYFDAGTYLIIRSERVRNVQGQILEAVTTYGDYKTVDGITIAYSMQSYVKGKDLGRQALNVTKIDLNPKVDKSFFTMPAAR